ncbi:hypothetical protein IHQ71_06770 [Rhizobium sp. TH2]|uniref:M10 family metallopeptidase C-terminal domain-containing protein n=1 Tax=Rhizobium sp. TH2 TaxID=2775403 RepID=UPI002157E388|nr:hypothetical protein [Rhizobium sp. TH2]UVC10302.1 hypothetical protein IHQ71_06770 [Rhizobium sp. TH2]
MVDTILVGVQQFTTFTINQSGNIYIFLPDSWVYTASDPAVHVTGAAGGNVLRIRGTIGSASGSDPALDVDAEDTRIVIEKSGNITAQIGIGLEDVSADIINNGFISGDLTGILLDGSVGRLINNGQIAAASASSYAVSQSTASGDFHLENHGVISGYGGLALEAGELTVTLGRSSRIYGVIGMLVSSQSGDTAEVVNHGLMSNAAGYAYNSGAGRDTFTNRGTIFGDINFGGGDDRFIDKGRFEGYISGGTGDDLFVLRKGILVDENIGGGTDSIRIGVTFTLPEEVENLRLTGSRNANATGNADANIMIGNAGDNRIAGGTAADTLSGGGGRDTFIYAKFDGGDTITDFKQGQDRIRIEGFTQFNSFADLDFIKSGNNVRISFADENGADFILVENQKIGDFDKADFLFG